MIYRLIKPDWARRKLANGELNPNFKVDIPISVNVLEGNFSSSEIENLNKLGFNVYFFPNGPKNSNIHKDKDVKFLNGRLIDDFNFIFVDMDLKDGKYKNKVEFLKKVSNFPIKPHLTFDSGNGIHVYWKIKNLKREEYLIAQFALINYFQTDDSVWTVLQLMRYPGSINTKVYGEPKPTRVIPELSTFTETEITDFPTNFFLIAEDQKLKASNHINKLEGKVQIILPKNVNCDELPDSFVDLMINNNNIFALFKDPRSLCNDRSRADMKLAKFLADAGFNRLELLQILANTEKALEKGACRMQYAELTVEKVLRGKVETFCNVRDRLKKLNEMNRKLKEPVRGPYYFDSGVLMDPWRKGQLLGLISGPGIGKTSLTLKIFKDMILNNQDDDEIFIFFSLEMSEEEIIDRWLVLNKNDDHNVLDRLYVVSNNDDEGNPRNIGLQEIHDFAMQIKQETGKNIKAIGIDHIGIISTHIDIRKKHTFGVESEKNTGIGNIRALSANLLASQLKPLSKMLDSFIIVLTQTTKGKGQGDNPIDKDGAYGISQYENIMDYVMTVWQPLMRIQKSIPERFLAWQYAKIRNKKKGDKVDVYLRQLLTYNLDTGDLTPTSDLEFAKFQEYLPLAIDARKKLEKNAVDDYSRTYSDNQNTSRTQSILNNMSTGDN